MPELKEIARKIFAETLAAIDIPATLCRKLARTGTEIHCADQKIDLSAYERIVAMAIGKAGFAMASGLCELLAPEFAATGILAIPTAPPRELPGFRVFLAGHPVPNAESLEAGRSALNLLKTCDERTLVFFLLSGGGSALCEFPLDPAVSLADIQQMNRVLVTCGAPIDDINAVRKHLSAVKGGRLAAAAPGAMKITLGVTDVPAGRESALASGPTVPDPTTVEDVFRVIGQYDLLTRLPLAIRMKLEKRTPIPETPKPGDAAFARAHFSLLLDMHDLFHNAHRAAEAAGFVAICDNKTDDWPIELVADTLLRWLAQLKNQNPQRPVCLIADGEVSSPVKGSGIGGRNSAFALYCVEKITGQGVAVLSAGTDGVDGNSPAAGAVADGETLARARAAGLDPNDYFARSDAYTFFKKLGDTVETGPTGNNLRDLRVLLME